MAAQRAPDDLPPGDEGAEERSASRRVRRRGQQYPPRPSESISDMIRSAGTVAWALVGIAIAIAIFVYVGTKIDVIFPPLILAGMIVFILNPVVSRLQSMGIPRAAGAALAYLAFFALVALGVSLAVPAIQNQAQEFSDRWPTVQQRIEHWIDARAEDLKGTPFEFDRKQIVDRITHDTNFNLGQSVKRASEIGFRVLEILLIFILAPILAFYILVDLPHLRRVAEGLIPPSMHEDVILVSRRVNHALGGFFRGQLVVAIIVGILSSIGLRIIGLPFWLIVGMIAGLFNLIPLIGPWVGAVPAIIIALTTREPITAVWAALVLLIVQQIDNHFISPLVMHRAVKIHPVLVMVVLLLGGSLFGFFGLLVAVPATATIKIVASHVWRVRLLGQTPEEWYEESEAADEIPGVGAVEGVPVDEDVVLRRFGFGRRRRGASPAGEAET